MMLKICLIGQRFQILSRATDLGLLWPMARGLARLGHKVTVISAKSPQRKSVVERDGVIAYYLHEETTKYSGMPFSEAAYQKFIELHRADKFDLVHSLDDSGYRIGKNRKALGVAMAYDIEATQASQLLAISGMSQETASSILRTYVALTYKFLTTYFNKDRHLLRTADGVFVTHPNQRVMLERYYLYPDFHIYNLPYGAEISDLSARDDSHELRAQLGLPDHAKVAVTVSDMVDSNEVMPILCAFEKVALKKPNAYLVIVGTGPQYKQIEYEALNRALGRRVIMPGATSNREISDYVSIADMFINLSSRAAGFDYGVIDAMAQKKILVGSEVSPISNFIEDEVDGFLIRPADYEALAELMFNIFSDHFSTVEMGEKARQKVTNMFDPHKMIQMAVAAYDQILANRGLVRNIVR
jgi:1,2-diacylglycerol 3-alpha-glucosyltransferase